VSLKHDHVQAGEELKMNVVEGIKFAAKHRQINQIIGIFMRFFAVLLPVFYPGIRCFSVICPVERDGIHEIQRQSNICVKTGAGEPSDHSQMVIDALGYLLDESLKAELSRRTWPK
jgi:hypothetical protein